MSTSGGGVYGGRFVTWGPGHNGKLRLVVQLHQGEVENMAKSLGWAPKEEDPRTLSEDHTISFDMPPQNVLELLEKLAEAAGELQARLDAGDTKELPL